MDWRKLIPIIVTIAFSTSCSSQEVRFEDVPSSVRGEIVAWTSCRGDFVGKRVNTDVPPEEIANAAAEECKTYERRVESAFKALGPPWIGQAAKFSERYRQQSIVDIKQLRSGQQASTPLKAWSQCIGLNLHQVPSKDFDQDFDAALNGCSSLEPAARDALAADLGEESADQNLKFAKETLRSVARNANDAESNAN